MYGFSGRGDSVERGSGQLFQLFIRHDVLGFAEPSGMDEFNALSCSLIVIRCISAERGQLDCSMRILAPPSL
jgi:hypothetical protein